MPDPVIVPPTPVINQGDSPEEIQRVQKSVQDIFDKVAPKAKGSAEPAPVPVPPAPAPPEPAPSPEPEPRPPEPLKAPSFIEQALKGEPRPEGGTPAPGEPEVFPEEMPVLKNAEEVRAKYHSWRDKYKELKEENKRLKERPALDESTNREMSILKEQNQKLSQRVSQIDVQQSEEFQQKVLMPMQRAWTEAAQIVKEAGGDPEQLARALSLGGKAQYEALDEIFLELPESAKAEAHNALSSYRRYDEVRRQALANAPQTAMQLRKLQLEAQRQFIAKQQETMGTLFEDAVRRLRDEAGVEVLRKSQDPEAKWWNDQADELVATSRSLYLDNADLGRMAMACVLAPMADAYRKLWFGEREARLKAEQTLKEKFGSEPFISESGGAAAGGPRSVQEDLKRPFSDVFLEKFHQLQSQGR